MAVKAFSKDFTPGKAAELYAAQMGDISIEVRSSQVGSMDDPGNAGLISFRIGGPELDTDGRAGLFCATGEYSSDTEAGDVWWASVAGPPNLAQESQLVPLSVLVRTKGAKLPGPSASGKAASTATPASTASRKS